MLDLHELAAGKVAALLARSACRDLFDTCVLLGSAELDRAKLRLGFVVYGGCNRKDWREVSPAGVTAQPRSVWTELAPMLRADLAPGRADPAMQATIGAHPMLRWKTRNVRERRGAAADPEDER
ncbi:MAG: nucleotidyl transferase AbiEii/AbiGii toxin family protein [Candidatus Latescibacterota bacterium]